MQIIPRRPFIFFVAFSCLLLSAAPRPAKKVIYYGWDTPETNRFVAEFDAMKNLPFAGYVFCLDGTDSQGRFQGGMILTRRRYEEAGFEALKPNLQKIAGMLQETPRELFAMIWSNPEDISWFDDEGWSAILHNTRLLARYARLAGAKGFCFDPEPYTAARPYNFQPGLGHSYAETAQKARERGTAFMKVIREEFPEAVLLTFGLWEWCFRGCAQIEFVDDISAILENADFNLLAEFANGWLSAIDFPTRIIVAPEAAYHFITADHYYGLARQMKGSSCLALRLIPEELHPAYRTHVDFGYGMFLDVYMERGAKDLCRQLELACYNTDEYIWLYGERGKFWPGGEKTGIATGEPWEKFIPEVLQALKFGQDPIQNGLLSNENLAVNGDMSKGKEGYSEWLADWSKGTMVADNTGGRTGGALRFNGVLEGTQLLSFPVKPGEYFKISVWAKAQGESKPSCEIRWQTETGAWRQLQEASFVIRFPGADKDWVQGTGYVRVPEGDAGRLVCLLYSRFGKDEQKDVVWFDDLDIRKIEFSAEEK